jgi:hypothetical protein
MQSAIAAGEPPIWGCVGYSTEGGGGGGEAGHPNGVQGPAPGLGHPNGLQSPAPGCEQPNGLHDSAVEAVGMTRFTKLTLRTPMLTSLVVRATD